MCSESEMTLTFDTTLFLTLNVVGDRNRVFEYTKSSLKLELTINENIEIGSILTEEISTESNIELIEDFVRDNKIIAGTDTRINDIDLFTVTEISKNTGKAELYLSCRCDVIDLIVLKKRGDLREVKI